MRYRHIRKAIEATLKIAEELEDDCPASQADTPAEDAAHELIHALRDAAHIAERQIGG